MSKPHEVANERRALLARLSSILSFAGAALALIALAAPAAHAEQLETLVLVKTNPSSKSNAPANSTTPLVFGGEEGTVTTALPIGPGHEGPIAASAGPANEVEIYASPDCEGEEPLGMGTLEEFEETGIQVEAFPESETRFYAIQSDPTEVDEPSDCSPQGFTYWHSSTFTPPGEPPGGTPGGGAPGGESVSPASIVVPTAPRLRTVPGRRANDNAPLLTGDASGADAVKVFSGPDCTGSALASGSAAEFAAGLRTQVPDDSVNVFSAVSLASGKQSDCSAPVTYVEDSTAPRTRITMGPGAKTRKRKAVFRFTDTTEDPVGTVYLCKVDSRKWKPCHSPFKLRHLGLRRHVLRVRAIDLAGNAETKGAKRRFKVIRRP